MLPLSSLENNKKFRILFSLSLTISGFVFNCVAYYPGFMSSDSFDQYTQALTNDYHNWHPPIMSALWHVLLIFHKGQEPMFFLQLIFLWLSFYYLVYFFTRYNLIFSLLVILFIFSPFIQNYSAVILKDIQMALAWLLAVSIMLKRFYMKQQLEKAEAFLILLLLTYGSLLRFNALPGAIPLIVMGVYLSREEPKARRWSVLILKTFVILIFMIASQLVLNELIIKPKRVFPENKLFMQDLTGIYVVTGRSYFPGFISSYPGFDSVYLKENYTPATFDHIWWNADGKDLFSPALLISDANSSVVLRKAWLKAIFENKGVYLKNRYKGFLNCLRIYDRADLYHSDFPYISPNNYNMVFKPNAISKLFINLIANRREYVYMKPWFWLLMNCLLLILTFIRKPSRLKVFIQTLLISSFLYLSAQFFIFQVDTDLRYFYWNCVSVSLAFILLLFEITLPEKSRANS